MAIKDGIITINEWNEGIGPSSYLGFQEFRGLDVVNKPGILQINPALEKQSASVILDFPTQFAKPGTSNEGADMWALDNSQNLYRRISTTWTKLDTYSQSGSGQGIVYWKDFLFVFRGTAIDVIGPLSSSVSTTASWQTLATVGDAGDFNFAVHAKDDILYIGNGRYVASIEELTDFLPGTGSTFTYTQKHLTLPEGYEVTAMAELGEFIYVGTKHNYRKVADIFPWDKLSQESETPISYNENGINQMIVKDNALIVHAGTRGKIYSGTTLIAKIPDTTTGLSADANYTAPPGAMSVWDDKVLFAVLSASVNFNAVYGITPQGSLTIEHIVSSDSTNFDVTIGAVLGNDSELLVGWKDATAVTQGVDVTNINNKYTANRAFGTSQWYRVGTATVPKTFKEAQIILSEPLIANQEVKLEYRTSEADSFTQWANFTAAQLHHTKGGAPTARNIQFKVSFVTPNATSNNIPLLEIRIK